MAVAQAACAALDRHFGRTRGLPRARRGHHRRPPSGQARPRAAPLLLQHRPRGLLRLAQCSRLPCGVAHVHPADKDRMGGALAEGHPHCYGLRCRQLDRVRRVLLARVQRLVHTDRIRRVPRHPQSRALCALVRAAAPEAWVVVVAVWLAPPRTAASSEAHARALSECCSRGASVRTGRFVVAGVARGAERRVACRIEDVPSQTSEPHCPTPGSVWLASRSGVIEG
mmetsp:Transcript_60075/g.164624  ORF Transcript_60075/g.164624 Transcript_60075/m.164624 type:complete len:226 (+) Transcript_60075:206-883(+)